MSKLLIVVLALFGASVSSSANADEFGRAFRGAAGATAGVVIVGGISCALTRAFLSSSIALCSPNQLRQAGYGQPAYGGGYAGQQRPQVVYVERHVVPSTTTTVQRIVPAVPPQAPMCPSGRPSTPVSSDTGRDGVLHVHWVC